MPMSGRTSPARRPCFPRSPARRSSLARVGCPVQPRGMTPRPVRGIPLASGTGSRLGAIVPLLLVPQPGAARFAQPERLGAACQEDARMDAANTPASGSDAPETEKPKAAPVEMLDAPDEAMPDALDEAMPDASDEAMPDLADDDAALDVAEESPAASKPAPAEQVIRIAPRIAGPDVRYARPPPGGAARHGEAGNLRGRRPRGLPDPRRRQGGAYRDGGDFRPQAGN